MLNNLGLFHKITLSICLLFGVVFVVTGVLVSRSQTEALTELLLQNARTVTKSLAVSSKNEILKNNFVNLPEILGRGLEGVDVSYAYITDRDGVCLAHTSTGKVGEAIKHKGLEAWKKHFLSIPEAQDAPEFIIEGLDLSSSVLEVIYPIRIAKIRGYYGRVHVGLNKTFITGSRKQLTSMLFWIFLAAVLMGFVFASVIAMQATRPISQIVTLAERIARGNYEMPSDSYHFLEEKYLKESLRQMGGTICSQIDELAQSNISLDRKVFELEVLMNASMKMNSKCYSSEVLEHILDKAVEGLSGQWASLLLADEEEQVLIPRVVRGDYKFSRGPGKIGLKEGIAGKVFTGLEPYVAKEGARDSLFLPLYPQREKNIKSMVCVPLVVEDKAIGVINVMNKRETDFNENDVRLLVSLASLLARSLENAQLYNLAITDGLSGLYIKRYFEDRLLDITEQAKRYGHAFSLLYCDIDFFKRVNDSYGHVLGDQVICKASAKLLEEARDNIDLVARIGGEEFAVILPETDRAGAVSFANRVRERMESGLGQDSGLQEAITMSFGVATYPEHGQDSEALIRSADKALYASKEGGRNRVSEAVAS